MRSPRREARARPSLPHSRCHVRAVCWRPRGPPHKPHVHVLRSRAIWQNKRFGMEVQARRFLFQPRRWVKALGRCVMERAHLRPSRFIVVHDRTSPEKTRETGRGHLPRPEAYALVAASLAGATNLSDVFVQTSNPWALKRLAAVLPAAEPPLAPSWTNNTRTEHDAWGGRGNSTSAAMEAGVVAAVNLYVASRAPLFVSLSASMWNRLVEALVSARPLAGRGTVSIASGETAVEVDYSDGGAAVELAGHRVRWTHVHCGGGLTHGHTLSVLSHEQDQPTVQRAIATSARCVERNKSSP